MFADDGIDVYLYLDLDSGGNVHLQAPALNMLDLVNQSVTGRREEVYNIVLREPDPSLFRPPLDAAVEPLSGTRGIRLVPYDEHSEHQQHQDLRRSERAKMYPRGDR